MTAFENAIATGSIAANAARSPPHITVSVPLIAPRLPPDTGASMKCRPSVRATVLSSRAIEADAVV